MAMAQGNLRIRQRQYHVAGAECRVSQGGADLLGRHIREPSPKKHRCESMAAADSNVAQIA